MVGRAGLSINSGSCRKALWKRRYRASWRDNLIYYSRHDPSAGKALKEDTCIATPSSSELWTT